MKTNNGNESEVLRTKKIMFRGKMFEIQLTKKMEEDIRQEVRVAKLNGWGFDTCLHGCPYGICDDWQEEVARVWSEMEVSVEVGEKATLNLWSDRRAMTVTKVISPRKVEVMENKTICKDWYASSYEILPELTGRPKVFTLRKGGTWIEEGQPKKYGSVSITLGFRHHYIDPSF